MLKIKQALFLLLFFSISMIISDVTQAAKRELRVEGSQLAIVYSSNESWLSKHTAQELGKYIAQMTGSEIPILRDDDSRIQNKKNIILVGNSSTNKVTGSLVDKGILRLDKIIGERDVFTIRSIRDKGKNYLILAGGNDIATLYAAYTYLEEFCEIGFFQDGDYVPEKKALVFRGIDVFEKPRFEDRMHNCFGFWATKKYQVQFWDFEDWKKYFLNWMVKKKANLMFLDMEFTERLSGTLFKEAFPEIGPEVSGEKIFCGDHPKSWNWPPEYRTEQLKKILSYGRKLGIRFAYFLRYAEVPSRYKKLHPELKYVDYAPGYPLVHPDDPMAEKIHWQLMEKLFEMYGTDHYYMYTPYAEHDPGADPVKLKLDAVLQLCKVYEEIDPKAIWVMDSWDFTFNPGGIWTKKKVKEYLDALPPDMTYIYDTTADMLSTPEYKRHNYFYGKKWAFGIVNAYAWEDMLYGDLWDITRRLKEVATDPKAINCKGVHIAPELTNYNIMYRELLTKLSWDPVKVDVDRFLKDYTVRRYGRKSMRNMLKCNGKIAQAMKLMWPGYPCDIIVPAPIRRLHQKIWDIHVETEENYKGRLISLKKTIPLLEEALGVALREKDNQEGNKLYENDLVDIARSYIGQLSDLYLSKLYFAFLNGDRKEFERLARKVNEHLEWIEKILSTRKDFSLEEMVKDVMKIEGTNHCVPELIRYDIPAGGDYTTNEIFEQLHYYYRPQVNAYFDELRERSAGDFSDFESTLHRKLEKVKTEWLQRTSIHVGDEYRFKGSPLEAVEAAFATTKTKEGK